MRDKINNFLNCLIGAFIGVFLARSVYTYWDYKTHPELYAVTSAPWYTTILLFGVVSAGIILAAFIVKLLIGEKLTFQNQTILPDAGRISNQVMEKRVRDIYEQYDQRRREYEALEADRQDMLELQEIENSIINRK